MQFSYFVTLFEPEGPRPYHRMIAELREQVVACDQAGFRNIWLGEHHFGPEGMGNLPNPLYIGVDLAHHTRTIRIGIAAVILPWWHPVRAAEDLAVVDHLVEGRLDVAFGKGVWPREGPNFHPRADPRDGAANLALFNESMAIVKKCWTEEFFAHEGEHYAFPAPGMRWSHPLFPDDPRWRDGDRVTRLCVTPKPHQKPHPPLWQVCSSPQSVRAAAEHGLGVLMWQPPPKRVRALLEEYARVRSEREGRAVPHGADAGVLRQVYVAPTMDEARAGAKGGTFVYLYNNPFRGLSMFMNPGEEPTPDMEMNTEFLLSRDALIVGDPEHVAERIARIREVSGLECLLIDFDLPYLSHAEIMRSIELFATRVIPALEGSPDRAAPAGAT